MKKILGIAALAAMMGSMAVSCDNVDEYVPPTGYKIDWNAAADSSTTALIHNFWNDEKGFFNAKSTGWAGETNNYWPQAHAMDVVIDAYLRTGDTKYSAMFDKWFEGIKTQCWSSGRDKYWVPLFDDNAWIGCTMMRIYDINKDSRYLEAARYLFEDMMKWWDEEGVGGLPWGDPRYDYGGQHNQSTPTNGPACILGFRIYEATGEQKYLDDAMRIYEFLREYIVDPATGKVVNGINGLTLDCSGEGANIYSYNHGTVMASAYRAFKHTGNALYLKDARRIAYFAVSQAFCESAHNVLYYENYNWAWDGPDFGGDCALFRAILFHYLADIIEAPELEENWRDKFFASMNATANYLWRNGLKSKANYDFMLFGMKFDSGIDIGGEGKLNPQVTAAACIEMRARLFNSLGK